MPRALTVKRTVVPKSGRAEYIARLRERQSYYKRAGCSFWVFEEAGLPGAYIEFTEAPSAKVLAAAHDAAPEQLMDANRIYQEVEL
ncbi:MAG TPA: hypothetical protein VFJ74_04200 [Gemmatimonadaceae bacterium]|nr:hypothetical protein [Gemmatimonadaceae bacterium]